MGRLRQSRADLGDCMCRIQSAIKLHGRQESMAIERFDDQMHCRVFHSVAQAPRYRSGHRSRNRRHPLGLPRLVAKNWRNPE